MKCIFLAAGYATRLYPLTQNYPKPLLPIGSSTVLDRLIADLESTGKVDEYITVSNARFADIFSAWAAKHHQRITVLNDGTESNETRLGAVKDILFALRETGIRDDVLVMAGDNALDFSLSGFLAFSEEKGTSCVMCHEENELARLRKTAVITTDENGLITSYEEKPEQPKGSLAVPPFYFYKAGDIARIGEALDAGCGYDAPGSFAAWLSRKTRMHAYRMPGKRFDIGDIKSYDEVKRYFEQDPENT